MNNTHAHSSDVAFTPTVKALQARKGSREAYARMEETSGWGTRITPELARFIEAQISVFLATVNADGQPYIQHRGGPAGFLHVLDEETVAFVDFAGNRQFITQGNLLDKPPASRHPKARARYSYHFLEVLPRRNRLILPLEFSEMESPPLAGDRSE